MRERVYVLIENWTSFMVFVLIKLRKGLNQIDCSVSEEFEIGKSIEMDYYRSQITDGILPSTSAETNMLNIASDSYASDYWNIPYSNGLSPMKQIEGRTPSTKYYLYSYYLNIFF